MIQTGVIILLALLAFAYVGYPLFVFALARLFARPVKTSAELPPVSLIVAAYNEAPLIAEKVRNSLALDYPTDLLEIIFVTDGSDDGTDGVVAEFESDGVRLLHSAERRGKSAAINRAVPFASHDILVFSDANAFYLPDTIRKLVRNFGDPSVGGVSGRKSVRKDSSAIAESEGAYWKYESFLKKQESKLDSTTGVVGEMMSLRKALYTPIPAHIINDDAFLAVSLMQQRQRVIYEPEAICWEDSAESTQDETVRRKRIAAGRFQLLFSPKLWPWRNPLMLVLYWGHKFLRLLLGFIMAAALLGNLLVLALPNPPFLLQAAAIAQLLFYGLAGWGYALETQQKKRKLPSIAYYITSGNLAGIGGFFRYLSGQQTVLWQKAARKPIQTATPDNVPQEQ